MDKVNTEVFDELNIFMFFLILNYFKIIFEYILGEWGRYTKGSDAILFVIDANALHLFPDAKQELHRLLEDKSLSTTPILIVANKIDLEPHATESVLVKGMHFFHF